MVSEPTVSTETPAVEPSNERHTTDQAELVHDEERQRNRAAIQLLRSWCEVDEEEAQEQRETWEYLKRALDEDRTSYRKLFP